MFVLQDCYAEPHMKWLERIEHVPSVGKKTPLHLASVIRCESSCDNA